MKKIDWLKKKCVPCEGGVPVLSKEVVVKYLKGLKGWTLTADEKGIRSEFLMKDFMAAIQLINRIAKLAEKEDHHPNIHLTAYRKLVIKLTTHALGGLSENDFILAAKIDRLPRKLKQH